MHSREILRAKHFEYVLLGDGVESARDFSAFCPDYQDTDRLGAVSPCYEEGVLSAAYAILGFVTAFYDVQRSRSSRFFIYPQHFAFFDWNQEGIRTGWNRFRPTTEKALASWANLDVYPKPQWIGTDGTVIDMLERVIACGVNRLLWPACFKWESGPFELPPTLQPWLNKQLSSIYLYGSAEPTVEIRAAQIVEDLVLESIHKLPEITEEGKGTLLAARAERRSAHESHSVEAYRQVSTDQFVGHLKNIAAS